MRRFAIMLAAALLLVSCAFSPAGERSVNIITVGFGYPGTAEELPSPHSDARAMASELKLLAEASGFDVSLLSFTDDEEGNIVHDGKAITAGDMVKLMKGLRTEPQDLTIFYYSGHGAWQEEPGSMIILPGGSGMTLSSISGLLSGIGGRSLMLIDACHSGSIAPGSVGSGEIFAGTDDEGLPIDPSFDAGKAISDAFHSSFSASRTYSDVYALTACIPEQVSYDGGDSVGHSIFTAAVLDTLGYDADTDMPGLPGRNEISFSWLYQRVWDELGSIPFGDGSALDYQTPQPSRFPTDLILFRFTGLR